MNLFGTQLQFAYHVLQARAHPVDAGAVAKDLGPRLELAGQLTKLVLQVVISVVVLVACFYLIKSGANAGTQKSCFALIGTVVGYWLR